MTAFAAYPTPEQALGLERHCRDARYVWNLALEQQKYWRKGGARRTYPPGSAERYQDAA